MKNEFLIDRIQLLESIVFAKDNILNSSFRFVSFFICEYFGSCCQCCRCYEPWPFRQKLRKLKFS